MRHPKHWVNQNESCYSQYTKKSSGFLFLFFCPIKNNLQNDGQFGYFDVTDISSAHSHIQLVLSARLERFRGCVFRQGMICVR